MSQSNNFRYAHEFTARWEGGLTDHPADRGGITAYGVSLAFLRDVARSNASLVKSLNLPLPVSAATVRKVTPDIARQIFHSQFWQPYSLDNLYAATSCLIYDANVNHGPARSIRLCQQGLNACGASLAVDGLMGPKTRAAIQKYANSQATAAIIAAREKFYHAIVAANPSQKVFLKGWLNRAKAIRAHILPIMAP